MLPDCLVPYKHYNEETISGVLDDIVNPDDEDSEIPLASLVYFKSIQHRRTYEIDWLQITGF